MGLLKKGLLALFFLLSISSVQAESEEAEIDPSRPYVQQLYGTMVDIFLWREWNISRPYYTSSNAWAKFCPILSETYYSTLCRDVRDMTLSLEGVILEWAQQETKDQVAIWEMLASWKSEDDIPAKDRNLMLALDMIYKGKAPPEAKGCIRQKPCSLVILMSKDQKNLLGMHLITGIKNELKTPNQAQ